MTALDGEIVTFIGRLEAASRTSATRAVVAAGGSVGRALTRRTSVCVVGHGALRRFLRVQQRLQIARDNGVALLSENAFLRRVGFTSPATSEQHLLGEAELMSRSGIAPEHLRWLVLFDIVEPSGDGRYTLRHLLLVRSVCTLLNDGLRILDVVRELAAARGALDHLPPNFFGDAAGRVAVRLGRAVSEIGGQLRLPLPTPEDLSEDALFAEAEEAEEFGDWTKAERLYRRCLGRDRSDSAVAYNLGNVLSRLGRECEARLWLHHAVGLDPSLAEGWYNLGLIARASGEPRKAASFFEKALAAEPAFADAMFNLAVLRFENRDPSGAEAMWRRYLEHDSRSEWARKARCGLALCRQLTPSRGDVATSSAFRKGPKTKAQPISRR